MIIIGQKVSRPCTGLRALKFHCPSAVLVDMPIIQSVCEYPFYLNSAFKNFWSFLLYTFLNKLITNLQTHTDILYYIRMAIQGVCQSL